MILFLFVLLSGVSVCFCDEDLGYGLNIGNSLNVFANYGDLCQVIRVISTIYEQDDANVSQEFSSEEIAEPFAEKNLRVFSNVTSHTEEVSGSFEDMMNIMFCDTMEDLFDLYFRNFKIQGISTSWKAFMGDWIPYEIMKTFGIYDKSKDDCCYVLVKLSKPHNHVKLKDIDQVGLMEFMKTSVHQLNASNTAHVREFMKEYGTHYIHSYSTGNAIYQVFKYKKYHYNMVKHNIRKQKHGKWSEASLRFFFSSIFLRQVGDIRVASGNKTVEDWARSHLRDSQYLFSRPTLFKLYYSPSLVYKLENLLDNGAVLSIDLKTLQPLFKDRGKREKYVEILENDLQLWENNI